MKMTNHGLSLFLVLLLFGVGRSNAQAVKDIVTLKIPFSALQYEDIRIRDSKPIYVAMVSRASDATNVNGWPDWTESLPSMLEARIEKISTNNKNGYTEVEMASTTSVVKLRFRSDLKTTFWTVAVPGRRIEQEAKAFANEAYKKIAAKTFTGLLGTLKEETKIALVKFLHENADSVSVSTEIYKERIYLAANMGDSVSPILNDAKFNQHGRVAYLFNEKLLKVLKDFAAPVTGARQVDGIKLALKVQHYNFVTKDRIQADNLVIYAPSETIAKFAAADITSQQFVDSCIIIVNDNRISVPLAAN